MNIFLRSDPSGKRGSTKIDWRVVGWFVPLLITLTLWIGVLCVIFHFVRKYW